MKMLQIIIPSLEMWNEKKEEFVVLPEKKIVLEHSLVSISKWERKWGKPFISEEKKTYEETVDYVKCMTITQNVDDSIYNRLTVKNIREIDNYINAPMTAAWFSGDKNKGTQRRGREQITSEIIYYWMITYNIPVEFQKWHLNSLLTLIRVCHIKNNPPKARSKKEIMKSNAEINAMRRKKLHTKG